MREGARHARGDTTSLTHSSYTFPKTVELQYASQGQGPSSGALLHLSHWTATPGTCPLRLRLRCNQSLALIFPFTHHFAGFPFAPAPPHALSHSDDNAFNVSSTIAAGSSHSQRPQTPACCLRVPAPSYMRSPCIRFYWIYVILLYFRKFRKARVLGPLRQRAAVA